MNEQGMVLVVGNPFSGTGNNRRRVRELVGALEFRGIGCEVIWEVAKRTEILSSGENLGQYRAVVVCGGDGTVAAVINEMDHSAGVPMAAMAGGNENLFAREVGFPGNVEKLAEAIASNNQTKMDLGVAELADGRKRYFSLMTSAGFDAQVIENLAKWREIRGRVNEQKSRPRAKGLKRVSRISYLLPMLRTIGEYRFSKLRVTVDGERVEEGYLAVVMNLPLYGPGYRLAPDARVDDGLLDWIVFRKAGIYNMLRYAMASWRGKHLALGDVAYGRGKKVDIEASGAVATQADGDRLGHLPVSLSVEAGLLTLVRRRLSD